LPEWADPAGLRLQFPDRSWRKGVRLLFQKSSLTPFFVDIYVIPEPITVFSGLIGLSMVGAYVRRRRGLPAST